MVFKRLVTIIFVLAIAHVAPAQDAFSWVTAGDPVQDFADVLNGDASARLENLAEESNALFSAPFYVITIPSLAEYGGQDVQLDTYTQQVLDAIQRSAGPDASDRAVLLLFVKEENRLRAASGSGWTSDILDRSRAIVQQVEGAYMAQGDVGGGMVEAAVRLVDMVQDASSPGSGTSLLTIALAGVVLVLVAGGVLFYVGRQRGVAQRALPGAVLNRHESGILRSLKKGADPNAFDEQGYTAAIHAASNGEVQVLEQLLAHGAKLGLGTSQGETPLYSAAQHGHLETVKFLLKNGVPVDPETVHRETPLLIAAREDHVSIVRLLLEAGANVNQQDNRGWSALMIAIRENHTDLINLLLGHNVDVNLAPKEGAHALMMAVKQEDEDLARRLLEHGADVHHVDRAGMCALRIAVLRGNQAIARRLLNAGADVTAPFSNKETPIEVAIREGHTSLAEYLRKRVKRLAACMDILEVVARGDHERIKEIVVQVPNSVNVHSAKSRWTPLLIAVRAQQLEIAKTLLQHGADVHARSMDGKAAIAFAVDAGNLAMVKVLLEGGARIDQIDPAGTDLRAYAEEQGQTAIVEFIDSFVDQQASGFALFQAVKDDDPPKALAVLKAHPLCVDARTRHERWTPLLHAARSDNLPMAKLLLEYNAQTNLANSRGMTALMYAARGGNLELARLLVSRGADVRLRSREGNTACEFALDQGHARVVMLLQEVESQLSDLSRAGFPSEAEETKSDTQPVDGGPPPERTVDPDAGGDDGLDLLQAIRENDLKRAKQALHFNPDSLYVRTGPSELTPLHLAINGGLHQMTRLLVEAGADVNVLTRECKTPLYQAVARADLELVRLLLHHGAHAWQVVQGQTALQVAQAAGYDDIVAELTRTPAETRE